jgi:hypothetical protein
MTQLAEIKRYIDSFPRPNGLNVHTWELTKNVAFEVWQNHIQNRPNSREFYLLIRKPNGEYIIPPTHFRRA